MIRLIVLCGVCLLLTESAISLKCRSGVQQVNDQFRKIVRVCKKRSAGDDDYSDNSASSDDSNSNESSIMDMFDTKFFTSDNSKSNTQSWKNQNNNRNRGNQQRNVGNDQRYSINYTNGQWRNTQYNPNRGVNIRDFGYSDGGVRSSYDQTYNSNSQNYDKNQQRSCIVQCVFNELNMVDQRGFPEQNSVVQFTTRNIRNPELRDFAEEAVVECFRYLNLEMRQDKCQFSQNLLSCLSDKGKERCEDWDN
ncbi:general odorant-binding protein 71 isoform X2 [Pseudomyrmex gracilis]|uniref:general odorant-binding protein 71 isoform X2 n=1 Tax=Pseudomyrmex gracilis TaxID=219809 RepID=UPI000995B82F|nr:general odorant-binding protein 71 isoform X2 [Pseudomyrmex gracilis]